MKHMEGGERENTSEKKGVEDITSIARATCSKKNTLDILAIKLLQN